MSGYRYVALPPIFCSLAVLAAACADLAGVAPMLDRAGATAMRTGGCLRLVCALALWSEQPLQDCRVRPGQCQP